VKDLLLVRC